MSRKNSNYPSGSSKKGNTLFAKRGRTTITTSHRGVFLYSVKRRIQYVPRPRRPSNEITFPLCLFPFVCESHATWSRFVPNFEGPFDWYQGVQRPRATLVDASVPRSWSKGPGEHGTLPISHSPSILASTAVEKA